jgi:hypothetical protein
MSGSDGTAAATITPLDPSAFAASAKLAAWLVKVYLQGFIYLERLS